MKTEEQIKKRQGDILEGNRMIDRLRDWYDEKFGKKVEVKKVESILKKEKKAKVKRTGFRKD